ncbi:MAG: hypothetical protein JSW33_07410 [bacterium]|nr:MAG: hypothetical protein JSW33_07410 [bacterium]
MKIKTLFIINAVIAFVYGICFVLIPSKVLLWYGLIAGPSEALLGQFFGVALLGIGLITWFARNVVDHKAIKAVVLALLLSDLTGVIVSVIGTITGVMNTFGWSAVFIYLFLALAYAYFQFKKPDTPQE